MVAESLSALPDMTEQGAVPRCWRIWDSRSAPRDGMRAPENGFEPLGHFKSPYSSTGEDLAFVRFHAAWPVYCRNAQASVVTYHPPDKPVIVVRRLGRGLVAVVGDSCFAMNEKPGEG